MQQSSESIVSPAKLEDAVMPEGTAEARIFDLAPSQAQFGFFEQFAMPNQHDGLDTSISQRRVTTVAIIDVVVVVPCRARREFALAKAKASGKGRPKS